MRLISLFERNGSISNPSTVISLKREQKKNKIKKGDLYGKFNYKAVKMKL